MQWTLRTDTPARSALADAAMAAVAAVDGRARVARHLRTQPPAKSVQVVAIGKAASAMTLGAWDALGTNVNRALVITKSGHLDPTLTVIPQLIALESGHPVPDARSLQAGAVLLDFIDSAPALDPLLVLLSGGASSLVEVPVPGIDLETLQRANTWLLASGLPIAAINAVRKGLSQIKGGGLRRTIGSRPTQVLLISDVQNDQVEDIGSGLLICASSALLPAVPAWLQKVLNNAARTLNSSDKSCFIPHFIVASLAQAKTAAEDQARARGYIVHSIENFLDGDAAEAGLQVGTQVVRGSPGIYVWGGETTVKLPDQPGRGGRNQTLALAAATVLNGHPGVALLALGTDGTDGPGSEAGALVDGDTLARGRHHGLHPADCLARADAGTFLAASGDLIGTGPTGTNVMDLVLGIKV